MERLNISSGITGWTVIFSDGEHQVSGNGALMYAEAEIAR